MKTVHLAIVSFFHIHRVITRCAAKWIGWKVSCSVASGLHSIQDLALRPYTDVKSCSILVKRIQCSGLVKDISH